MSGFVYIYKAPLKHTLENSVKVLIKAEINERRIKYNHIKKIDERIADKVLKNFQHSLAAETQNLIMCRSKNEPIKGVGKILIWIWLNLHLKHLEEVSVCNWKCRMFHDFGQ